MRSGSQFLGMTVLVVVFGCSEAPQSGSPGAGSGGSAGSGVAGSGVAGSGVSGMAAGGASAGSSSGGSVAQAGSGGAGASAGGSAGSAGAGGFAGELSNDPGTRAYQIHCFACHGEQGVGTQLAPETQHPVRDFSSWVVRNGLPGVGYLKPMEAVPTSMLSDADLTLIYDYLDKPPQPTTAEGLYKDYCGNCHGADGKGGPTTRDITGPDVDPIDEIVRQGTHPGMFDERNEYMPAYSTMRVSDAELDLISGYVDTL